MKMLKWTSSPWGFRKTLLAEQCDWLEKMGIKYISMQCQCGPDMPGLLSPKITPAEASELRRKLGLLGLAVASVNGDGDYMVSDNVDAEIATTMHRLSIAAALGAKVLIVFAGWQPREDSAVYDQVAGVIKTVAQEAKKSGITVALENHGGLTATIEQCNRILAAVNEPNVGLNYDPANFLMYGQEPLDALKRIEHPVVFTHLKSLKATAGGKKEYCRLDDGVIDYTPIMEKLLAEYDGFFGLEYEETADAFAGSEADYKHLCGIIEKNEEHKSV